MRIAVVGAGVIGLSLAREFAGQGCRVTVYEQDRPGAGTSGTSFAWVNSHAKEPDSYHGLNLAGVRAHHELHRSLPDGPRWFHPTGNLEWATEPGHARVLERSVARLRGRGYAAEWIPAEEARAMEPGARIPDGVRSAAFFPDEGYVLPAEYLARLLTDALASGAEIACPAPVRAVVPHADGADIALADGSTATADAVVTAAGRWTEPLLATAGCHVPMADPDAAGSATTGYLAYTEPAPVRLERVLTTSHLNLRPDGGGRLVLQGLDLDADADPARPPGADAPLAEELLRRLARVLRGGEHARIAEVRVGQRSLPADGLTACGFADGGRRVYAVATHSGITLAPALAPLVADEVLRGTRSELLADFRADRFTPGERPDVHLSQVRLPGRQ
ncbi:glycine/D-amino acid oxidase-like deaminating enzyme [Spinactinospora alkalitolerans]|uniref:Glycine/D-amino acid oxidase-like deaminating enzyme n=1 Tax=Spinactinospora alkalitolerans TaxID=687207 RepID=A0A852TXR7_9ACTN|nr:FAD-binding oxidoreductase [Spinactinospora alkalitolerans]NYE47742.1 glycine/D-amino acid oxidase-like deaminating enzyme [Spinactinospora alkalitolerans]